MKTLFVPLFMLLLVTTACQTETAYQSPLAEQEIGEILELPATKDYQESIIALMKSAYENVDFMALGDLLQTRSGESLSAEKELMNKLSAMDGGQVVIDRLAAFETATKAFQQQANFADLDKADRDKVQQAVSQAIVPEMIAAMESLRQETTTRKIDVSAYIQELEKEMANK